MNKHVALRFIFYLFLRFKLIVTLFFIKKMKTSTKTFFVITIYLLGLVTVLAAPDPPPPNGRNQGLPTPPPGLPIDEYRMIFLALSLFFGMYVIFYHAQKNKQLDTK